MIIEHMGFVRLPDKLQALAYRSLMSVTDKQGASVALDAVNQLTGH